MWTLIKTLIPWNYVFIGLGALALASGIWFHGYNTANSSWKKWYKEEQTRQETINKSYYERGLKEATRLQEEEKKDEDILKQNREESKNDPNRNAPSLSRDSVRRLNRL